MPRFLSRTRVIICLLMLLAPASQFINFGLAHAQLVDTPFLSIGSSVPGSEGFMNISARGFTDGDLALVTVTTTTNQSVGALTTVESTPAIHGPNGSADPAQGYVNGGIATFQVWQRTIESIEPQIGSNIEPGYQPTLVEIGWPSEVDVQGPNGSADPAWGGGRVQTVIVACDSTVMLTAYDVASASLSNQVPYSPGC